MLLGRFEPLYPEFLDSKSRNPQFVDLPSVQLGSTEGEMADRQLTYRQYSKRHGSKCHRSKRQGLPNPLHQLLEPALQFLDPQRRAPISQAGLPHCFCTHSSFIPFLHAQSLPPKLAVSPDCREFRRHLQQHCPGARESVPTPI
jgi:hypothetical protein